MFNMMGEFDMTDEVAITPESVQAARDVLGFYHRPGGLRPGGFTSALIGAFEHADPMNFAKLASAYPELGEALRTMRDSNTGANDLLLRAENRHV